MLDLSLKEAIENMEAILLNPDGIVSISGSDNDREILQQSLEVIFPKLQLLERVEKDGVKKKYPAREDLVCLTCGNNIDIALGNGIFNSAIDFCNAEWTRKLDGIDYKSNNPAYDNLMKDAEELGQIYLDLKIILGRLQEIEDKHNLDSKIVVSLETVIQELSDADHIIVKIAKEILKEEKNA